MAYLYARIVISNFITSMDTATTPPNNLLNSPTLKSVLSPAAYGQLKLERLKRKAKSRAKLQAPADWQSWLPTLFPKLFSRPFADRHSDFWNHIDAIRPDIKPPAFFAIWSRGGGKTTNAEAAVVRLGAKEVRKFCLYVRGTQDKANESVQNIAAMLEGKVVERHYPQLASRKLGKYGNSKGWRVDTLRCANGFSVVALGLDAAVRGIKIEEFRPDVVILDDLDSSLDSPTAVNKKIDTLTKSILPAGSNDVAILGIQNLIHPGSIFSRINDGSAEFLYNRIVSGPYPAIEGLTYEQKPEGGYRITGGTATWEGQSLEVCEAQINEWGLTAFLQEAQHEVDDAPGGLFSHLEYRHCDWSEVPDLIRIAVWVDPAVTSTDQSDSMGIQADGLAADETIYRLWSWESITSPEDALRRATLKALELHALSVGVETDQGGDTWQSVYKRACEDLVKDTDYPHITPQTPLPTFQSAKAGAGHGPKAHRASLMLADYERGKIVHVRGTHRVLEKALFGFPLT